MRAEIYLNRLRDNYRTLKQIHGGKLLAVLKADAYGHGAVRCALVLEDLADGFAVACIEEALVLRKAGVDNPIVLLEGVFDAAEYDSACGRLWVANGSLRPCSTMIGKSRLEFG